MRTLAQARMCDDVYSRCQLIAPVVEILAVEQEIR